MKRYNLKGALIGDKERHTDDVDVTSTTQKKTQPISGISVSKFQLFKVAISLLVFQVEKQF